MVDRMKVESALTAYAYFLKRRVEARAPQPRLLAFQDMNLCFTFSQDERELIYDTLPDHREEEAA